MQPLQSLNNNYTLNNPSQPNIPSYWGTCVFRHWKAIVFCKITSKKRNYDFCMGTIIIVCGRSVHHKLKLKLSTFEILFLIVFERMCFKLNAKTSGVLKIKQNTLQPLFIKGRLVSVLCTTYFKFHYSFSLAFCFKGLVVS
jgi:hypothetical protein